MITNHDLDLIGPAVAETPSTTTSRTPTTPTTPCPDAAPPPGTDGDEPESESTSAD